jgi:hypothetical protein
VTVPNNRNRQKEYDRSRLRDDHRELHNGAIENEAADYVGSILVDSTTIDFTYNTSTPSLTAIVIDDSITDTKLRNSAAISVIGRSANSSGDPADIAASTLYDTLWYDGSILSFAQMPAEGVSYDNGTIVTPLTITNPGAEDGSFNGWTEAGGTWSVSTSTPHSGSYVFEKGFSTSAHTLTTTNFIDLPSFYWAAIDAGNATITGSHWIRRGSSNTGQSIYLQYYFYDSSDSLISSTTSGNSNGSLNTWIEQSISGYTIPATTRKIKIRSGINSGGSFSVSWRVDDHSVSMSAPGAVSSDNVQDAIIELYNLANSAVPTTASELAYDPSTSSLTATDVQAAIDEVEGRLDTVEAWDTDDISEGVVNFYYTAERARDDVGAALTQGTGIAITVDDGADTITIACDVAASEVTYDNTSSGLTATDVNAAIDEVLAGAGGLTQPQVLARISLGV